MWDIDLPLLADRVDNVFVILFYFLSVTNLLRFLSFFRVVGDVWFFGDDVTQGDFSALHRYDGVLLVVFRVTVNDELACVYVYGVVVFFGHGVGMVNNFFVFLCIVYACAAVVNYSEVLVVDRFRVFTMFFGDGNVVFYVRDVVAFVLRLVQVYNLHGRVVYDGAWDGWWGGFFRNCYIFGYLSFGYGAGLVRARCVFRLLAFLGDRWQ